MDRESHLVSALLIEKFGTSKYLLRFELLLVIALLGQVGGQGRGGGLDNVIRL